MEKRTHIRLIFAELQKSQKSTHPFEKTVSAQTFLIDTNVRVCKLQITLASFIGGSFLLETSCMVLPKECLQITMHLPEPVSESVDMKS
jgi:hypothetical protein